MALARDFFSNVTPPKGEPADHRRGDDDAWMYKRWYYSSSPGWRFSRALVKVWESYRAPVDWPRILRPRNPRFPDFND